MFPNLSEQDETSLASEVFVQILSLQFEGASPVDFWERKRPPEQIVKCQLYLLKSSI